MAAIPIAKFAHAVAHRTVVVIGSLTLTLAFFLVLPLMQTISQPLDADVVLQSIDTAQLPPPPPPPETEEQKEPEPEDQPPPELEEEMPPLDLSQLELALNAGMAGDWMSGDFAVKLNTAAATTASSAEALFSMADLDQRPRAIYQPAPSLTSQLRQKTPGTVYVIFVVDARGRVENPMIQSATDPAFEAPAIAAVKQWKFEPGKRNGEAVRFRMRVPITFPKGQ